MGFYRFRCSNFCSFNHNKLDLCCKKRYLSSKEELQV